MRWRRGFRSQQKEALFNTQQTALIWNHTAIIYIIHHSAAQCRHASYYLADVQRGTHGDAY